MIVNTFNHDMFKTNCKNIAFAINTEGYNDTGFPGEVADRCWKELSNCGKNEIGTILSKKVGDTTFYAIVCYSLDYGWSENIEEIIKDCFDRLPLNGEPVAAESIGTGFAGVMTGADFRKIIKGMHESKQQIELQSEYPYEDILDCFDLEDIEEKTR